MARPAQTSLARVAEIAAALSAQDTVYFGVALQRPDCRPDAYHRSTNTGAYVVPGLWFDLDLAHGQQAASTLHAIDAEALDFLASLPAPPTLIVHSGGGLYGHWLLKEPYIITSPEEYDAIKQLSERFTHTLVLAEKQRGWTRSGTWRACYGRQGRSILSMESSSRSYTKAGYDTTPAILTGYSTCPHQPERLTPARP